MILPLTKWCSSKYHMYLISQELVLLIRLVERSLARVSLAAPQYDVGIGISGGCPMVTSIYLHLIVLHWKQQIVSQNNEMLLSMLCIQANSMFCSSNSIDGLLQLTDYIFWNIAFRKTINSHIYLLCFYTYWFPIDTFSYVHITQLVTVWKYSTLLRYANKTGTKWYPQ